ncbi:MAG: TlpA family protein disulfide reductase [Spirochaetes bacterium]|nr:MAG: TlpA family protein disulfide reductase [Spirochaetota bacterium]
MKVVMNEKTNYIPALILLITVSVLFSGCSDKSNIPENSQLTALGFRLIHDGKEFPDITFTDINGDIKKLSDYRGNVLLLNFWATWCPPCRAEMPSMGKLTDKLNSGDFVMLPVNVKEPGDMVKTFTAEFGIDFPVYLDINAEAAMAVGVTALPTSILIDRDGNAVAAATGALEWDSDEMVSMLRNWTR